MQNLKGKSPVREGHTCVPVEARTPFGTAYHFIGMYVTRFEECVRARLIPVQVQALDLWLVQLEVKIGIQLRKHPTQGLIADRGNPCLQLCWGGGEMVKTGQLMSERR